MVGCTLSQICQLTPALVSRGPSAKASETRFPLKITRGVCLRRQTAARSPSCVGDGPLLRDGAAGRPHSSASPWAKFKPLLQCTCLIFNDLFLFLPIYTLSPGNSTCAVFFCFFLKCKKKFDINHNRTLSEFLKYRFYFATKCNGNAAANNPG